MKIPRLLRAATAVALALGMTSLGTAAAFADDAIPPADPATQSAPPADPAPAADPAAATDPAPESAPAPAVDPAPPASDPAPDSESAGATPPEAVPATKASQRSSIRQASVAVDPTPYKLLAWSLPCGVGDPWCAPGQTLVYTLDLAVGSLDALDDKLVGSCNDWQVDLENDSATTANLVSIGVLTSPNHPAEDHAYGAVPGNPWKYVDNPTCVTPAAVVTPQTCVQNTTLTGGSIQLSLNSAVHYTITDSSAAVVPFDPATGLVSGLAPGNYSVAFTLDAGYSTTVTSPIPLTVTAYTGPCNVPVTPAAVATDEGCVRGALLVDGHIKVTILTGVHYVITDSSATVVPFDATTGLTGDLASGSYSVAFTLDPGYVTAVPSPIPLTIAAYDGPCAQTPVTPKATATPQTCEQGVFLTGGTIQLTLIAGVTYTITDSSAAVVPFDPATGLATGLAPGSYSVSFVLDPTLSTAVTNPIELSVAFYDGPCDLVTDPLVTPMVSFTGPTCTSGGSYTLANDLGIAGAVQWTVNSTPGATVGTYPAATGSTVTIEAAATSPGYGFNPGQQTLWSHTFSLAGVACLDTLALTGSAPQMLGWIAALLTVSGLLVMRIRSRLNTRRSLS